MTIAIRGIDHIAMTVADFDASFAFYTSVLAAEAPLVAKFRSGDLSSLPLYVGGAVINMQHAEAPAYIVADKPTPGAVDICFRWDDTIEAAISHLESHGVAVIEGPVPRFAADRSKGQSVYFRDPDDNLLEFLTTVA
jgi:catechol 2,3-dioxygenase-like lactoylglutathione lyase family enzyme